MNNYIFFILVLFFFIPAPILGQRVDLETEKKIFIQPMIGLDFAFFDPSESRIQDQNLKDIEEFFTYGIGLGYDGKKIRLLLLFL